MKKWVKNEENREVIINSLFIANLIIMVNVISIMWIKKNEKPFSCLLSLVRIHFMKYVERHIKRL